MSPSVNDWAAKCASYIDDQFIGRRIERPTQERLAAVIATFAEPLVKLLSECRRSHSKGYTDESCDYQDENRSLPSDRFRRSRRYE